MERDDKKKPCSRQNKNNNTNARYIVMVQGFNLISFLHCKTGHPAKTSVSLSIPLVLSIIFGLPESVADQGKTLTK